MTYMLYRALYYLHESIKGTDFQLFDQKPEPYFRLFNAERSE